MPGFLSSGSATVKPLTEANYQFIRELVYEHSRINLGENKRELVTARLSKRLRATGKASYQDYIEFISSPAGEKEMLHLIDAISTNHTFFFREIAHFDFLSQVVLPEWNGGQTFRVWSAATSTGEEPYTLAMVMEEFFSRKGTGTWTLDGTDINSKVLENASQGIYAAEKLQKVPKEMLRKYFQKGTGEWDGFFRVKDVLRNKMSLHRLNLFQPRYPFQNAFDLIFCRNVMIYFDKATQAELVGKMDAFLKPGGYLMIGHAESLTGIQHPYRTIKPAIYRKPL